LLLGAVVLLGGAGAVALTLRIADTGSWWLPLAIAGVVLLLVGCVFVLPPRLAPPHAPEELTGVEGLSAKDRIQFADDRRKLQNDVRTALLQAVVGGAVLVGVLFTWQQQQATSRQVADPIPLS
jgi:4-amino-4-deoxy-L-arabinose transferase-like glycosyltransferase